MRRATFWNLNKPLRQRHNPVVGPYYRDLCDLPGTPGGDWKPDTRDGWGGYLNASADELDEGAGFRLRVRAAHDVVNLRHTGWYVHEAAASDTIYGIVARLPRGRGFLAGWTMGGNMCASLEAGIYETEEEAARAADSCAQCTAEREREYQEEREEEEAREEAAHSGVLP